MTEFQPFDNRQDLIEFLDGDTGETLYWGADGDEYYNAKGEKLKGFFQKFGKGIKKGAVGIGRGIKKVVQAIVKVERKIVGKSKDKAKGTKEGKKADRDKRRAERKETKELIRQKNKNGEDAFLQPLPKADANTPEDKKVSVGGQTLSTEGVPADKPLVEVTDPNTGEKMVGIDFKPKDVTAIQEGDGTYSYYSANQVQGGTTNDTKGMSSTMKIGLAVGGVAVLGLIIYLVAKKK